MSSLLRKRALEALDKKEDQIKKTYGELCMVRHYHNEYYETLSIKDIQALNDWSSEAIRLNSIIEKQSQALQIIKELKWKLYQYNEDPLIILLSTPIF